MHKCKALLNPPDSPFFKGGESHIQKEWTDSPFYGNGTPKKFAGAVFFRPEFTRIMQNDKFTAGSEVRE